MMEWKRGNHAPVALCYYDNTQNTFHHSRIRDRRVVTIEDNKRYLED